MKNTVIGVYIILAILLLLTSCAKKPYEAKYAEISDAEWAKINP